MSQSYQGSAVQNTGSNPVVATTQTPKGSASIPDLLRIGSLPSNTAIDVETAILEPVTQSETHCRFVLQNKGILHSHSSVEFCLASNDGAIGNLYLPVGVGILALIQRATLRVGTKTVCEIDDFNDYSSYRSCFLTQETEIEREFFQSGRHGNVYEIEYTDREVGAGATLEFGSALQSNTSAGVAAGAVAARAGFEGALMLGNGKEMTVPTYGGNGAAAGPGQTAPKRDLRDISYLKRRSGNGAAAEVFTLRQDLCPAWQIKISELFPFLKTNQLPIYMFKEPINFEFVFSAAGSTTVSTDRAYGETIAEGGISIHAPSTRMIADHIYYPQEMMESFANANRNMQFQYVDYRLSKFSLPTTVPVGNEWASTQIRNIGGAGRIVSKVIWGITNATQRTMVNATNKYCALGPARQYSVPIVVGDFTGRLTSNIKYNQQFLFPIDVSNSARHFHNVVQAEGITPHVGREVYSNEGIILSGSNLDSGGGTVGGNGFLNDSNVASFGSTGFWQASRLNRGERINSRGIELYMAITDMSQANGAHYVQKCWLETLRTAQLADGYLTCYYS